MTTYYELTPRGIRAIHPPYQTRTQTYASLAAARAARPSSKPHYKYDAAIFAAAREYAASFYGYPIAVVRTEVARARASAFAATQGGAGPYAR